MTKLHASIIVTYRCNARCTMCGVWLSPSKAQEEIGVDEIRKLPQLFFANVTGGEPFVREDLPELIAELWKKTKRIVISTNGFFTERIIDLCRQYPNLGIRISIEGLKEANDTIRGIPDGFTRIQDTLQRLRAMGMRDIGFAMTVQDMNYKDMAALYAMAKEQEYEFATVAVHNSHYFHKWDNTITQKQAIIAEFERLIKELLKSKKIKDWFRAYFNYGLINYVRGNPRLLPCEMGRDGFFVDPYGDVIACNGMDQKIAMGNLKTQRWEEIWHSKNAADVREAVAHCKKNCWMIGSVAPAIWHHPVKPALWVAKRKLGM